jgi:MFS family permease
LGIAAVQTYGLLVLLLMLFFASTGAFDVGINTAAVELEQGSGRKILSYFHAAFSGSAAVTALLTGALLTYGIPFRWFYLGLALLVFTFAVLLKRGGVTRTAASATASSTSSSRPERLPRLYQSAPVLLLAFITALGFQIEGEVGNWAAVYLRSLLELPAWLGASGVAVFHTAMLLGRLGAAQALQRYHRRGLLQLAGAVAAGGMLIALATEHAPVVLLGFLITGLAVAVVAPVTFSLVGDAVPDRVGEASSILTTVAYLGLLLGPVIIGGLAEFIGLRLALGSIIFMGGLISHLSCGVLRGRPVTSSRASAAYLDGSGA